jgi:membrane glycosyltransferase
MIGTSNFPHTIDNIEQPHMAARRFFFFALVVITIILLAQQFIYILSADGFGFLDFIMTCLFVVCLPWTVIGFWNGIIGFCVMQMSSDPVKAVTPFLINPSPDPSDHPLPQGEREEKSNTYITTSTAILFCVRNEDVEAVFSNIYAMATSLGLTQHAAQFHIYILSDTTDALIAQAEEAEFAKLTSQFTDKIKITYRLRDNNAGFKAGNIRDFCDRWGMNHDFMIVLDADSFMSSQAILNLVQIVQDNPRLGIVQHLTVGLPSTSAFMRIFQFGMRLGMRSYTVGSALWQGDCGPYWGHNAIIRISPFIEHCKLPQLSGTGALSGDILSHDQIEAVMMRRAGYECRVLPIEEGSYEENPPSLLEFIRRNLRWCQGNMQYLKLLSMKGVKPISRYQLFFAIWMFIGSPVVLIFGVIAALRLSFSGSEAIFDANAAKNLVFIYLAMSFVPKFATLANVLLKPELCSQFGGKTRIIISAIIETLFSFLLVPIMIVSEAIFLTRLAFGRSVGWGAHRREEYQLSFEEASQKLLPHTIIGIIAAIIFGNISASAFWWTLPLTLGLILSIPFSIITTIPQFGLAMQRIGLCACPEEMNRRVL